MPVSQQMLVLTKTQSVAHAGALHVTVSNEQILRPREKKKSFYQLDEGQWDDESVRFWFCSLLNRNLLLNVSEVMPHHVCNPGM